MKSVQREVWRALLFYNSYRVFLATAALTLVFLKAGELEAWISDPDFYRWVSLIYIILTLFSVAVWFRRQPGATVQTVFAIITDLVALVLFIRASGGLGHSPVEILLFVPVAASGILLSGRMAMFAASIAILLVLYDAVLNVLDHSRDVSLFFHSGLLGIALLATAIVVNRLAARAKKSEDLVRLHAASLEDLGEINEHIIQTMDSGVLVLDAEEAPLFMNNRARALLGVEQADLSGLGLSDISSKLFAEYQRWRKDGRAGKDFTCAKTNKLIQASFSPLSSDRKSGGLILIEETGEARRRQQQAKLAALGRLTGSIAHEIRNPLSAVSQAAQMLSAGAPADQQPRLAQLIERNTGRINRIVEDVMSLNKSDQIQRETLNLDDWIPRFIQRYCRNNNLDASFIRFDGARRRAFFDAAHLERVMQNLLDNAMQHGDASTLPVITLSVTTGEQSAVFIDVQDNGPGVDDNLVDTIFEPFFTGRPDGTGLGLYISRELCETNGGQLEYISGETGQGGFFRIILEQADA